MKHRWNAIQLGEVLKLEKNFISIDDLSTYKLCRVQTKAKGVVLREIKQGAEIKTKEQQVCRSGQVIFAEMDARFGGYGIIPENLDGAIVSSHYFLYAIDEANIDRNFLRFCFQQPWFLEQVEAKGSTNYAAIRPHHVLDYLIPLPEIGVQKQVVSVVESISKKSEEIKNIRKQQEYETNQLLYSAFHDCINNADWVPMHIAAPIVRRPIDVTQNQLYPELGVRSFGKGTFHKPTLTFAEIGTKKLFSIHAGDLLFSNVFAWEGAIAVAHHDDHLRVGSHRFISCVPEPGLAISDFMCYYFLTEQGMEKVKAASPGGAGRNRTLGLEKLKKITVPVPPIAKQEEFLALKSKIDQLKKYHNETVGGLEELYPALLNKYFEPFQQK